MTDTPADQGDGQEAERSAVDELIDLLVYAPLGLALSANEELPKWVERGRRQLAGHVPAARAVGSLAMSEGQRRLERLAKLAAEFLVQLGQMPEAGKARTEPAPAGAAETGAADAADATAEPAPDVAGDVPPDTHTLTLSQPAGSEATAAAPSAAELAIPGYDSLSASQVVQRLPGLAPDELEAVRAYEATTRRRKTILTRAAQLQAH